jgi:hypothetical protein
MTVCVLWVGGWVVCWDRDYEYEEYYVVLSTVQYSEYCTFKHWVLVLRTVVLVLSTSTYVLEYFTRVLSTLLEYCTEYEYSGVPIVHSTRIHSTRSTLRTRTQVREEYSRIILVKFIEKSESRAREAITLSSTRVLRVLSSVWQSTVRVAFTRVLYGVLEYEYSGVLSTRVLSPQISNRL